MEEKKEFNIHLDDKGLDDGTFLKSVVLEAIEYEKSKQNKELE